MGDPLDPLGGTSGEDHNPEQNHDRYCQLSAQRTVPAGRQALTDSREVIGRKGQEADHEPDQS